MELLTPLHWKDYELLDCGDFEKLERFGKYITIRPEPQAVWPRVWPESEWKNQAHIRFVPKNSNSGDWVKLKAMPDQWQIRYELPNHEDIVFRLGLTSFKHVGVFPEQAANWDYIVQSIQSMKQSKPKVLNLFAYTGGASLAAAAAGAEVTHVDSIKQVVTWANENMQLSNLDNIRWMVEDALKFAQREERRGNKYNGIILDPPAFGHGPKGEKWKLEDNLAEMMKNVLRILDDKEHFLILNAYSLGLSALVIENLLKETAGDRLKIGELYLQAKSGVKLPLGVFGRFLKHG
ncbi:MAG: class I SAM-dependent methyltransferase [Flavobacteriales bacterium]|jgi:23S rRNA (cytosine1962-C5)-methyltransferase